MGSGQQFQQLVKFIDFGLLLGGQGFQTAASLGVLGSQCPQLTDLLGNEFFVVVQSFDGKVCG